MSKPAKLVLVVAFACIANVWAQGGYTYKETRIGPLPPEGARWCFGIKGWHFGYLCQHNGKWIATVDGVEGPAYDQVSFLILFSPDESHYAYVAQKGDRWFVVTDGREGQPWDQIEEDSLVFSADSKHLAYAARKGAAAYAILDGVLSPAYEEVDLEGPVFSPDGRRVAYWARLAPEAGKQDESAIPGLTAAQAAEVLEKLRKGEKVELSFELTGGTGMFGAPCWSPVVDGVPGPRYDQKGSPIVFSPDSKRVAYAAAPTGDNKTHVYLDGVAGPALNQLGNLEDIARDPLAPRLWPIRFSPDSSRVAYAGWIAGKQVLLVDGVPWPAYGSVDGGSLQFSPDSKHVAYRASLQGKLCAVVDGVAGPPFDCMSMCRCPVFSRDSKHVAYKAAAVKGGSWCAVVDGVAGPPFPNIFGEVEFGADGKMAYAGGQVPDGMYLVVDGVAGDKLYSVGPIAFSPDGKRLAYPAALYGDGRGLMVDGAFVSATSFDPPYWGTADHPPIFSPDGKHVALVFRKDPKCVVTLDASASPPWDQMWGEHFAFHEDGTLEYLAVKDGILYNVKCSPQTTP